MDLLLESQIRSNGCCSTSFEVWWDLWCAVQIEFWLNVSKNTNIVGHTPILIMYVKYVRLGWYDSFQHLVDLAVSILARLIFCWFLLLVVLCYRAQSPWKNPDFQKAVCLRFSTYNLCWIRRVKCWISIIRHRVLAL